jgi:outer membrane protein assembly factor BamB
MNVRVLFVLAAGLGALALPARADDWPQWRGPDRSGVSKEKGLLKTWPKAGPKLEWTYRDAGLGYSQPAVVGDRIYTMGGRGDTEYLFALDAKDAKELWHTKVGPLFTFSGNKWGEGPRSTPTVDGDLAYALGGQGILVCVKAADGSEVWRKDLPGELAADVNPIGGGPPKVGWGFTWSPLVDGEQLVCVPGGKEGMVAALEKKTGKVLWRSTELTEQASYSSPIVAEVGGIRQYIVMTYKGVAGVAAQDGKLLWNYKRTPDYKDVLIPTPIFHDNCVFTTDGWGFRAGCDLVQLTAAGGTIKATKKYQNQDLANLVGGVVLVAEHVYGASESKKTPGWVCLDFKTGKVAWSDADALDIGSVSVADGNLYCYGQDSGTVVLVEPNLTKWMEKGRFTIPGQSKLRANSPGARTWTPPVIANGRLYVRDQELLFCYNIKE